MGTNDRDPLCSGSGDQSGLGCFSERSWLRYTAKRYIITDQALSLFS